MDSLKGDSYRPKDRDLAVTLGNTAGGVVIVGLLNYGQVRAGED